MRVLIIEDDFETAAFLKKSLKENGHVAELAHDGEAGLEFARHESLFALRLPHINCFKRSDCA